MAYLFEKETKEIYSACSEIHNKIGCGFHEKVYQDAFEVELKLRGIPYVREKHFDVEYKGTILAHDFFCDFLCYDSIIVEFKAVDSKPKWKSQVLNYLKASGIRLGVIYYFNEESLKQEYIRLSDRIKIMS